MKNGFRLLLLCCWSLTTSEASQAAQLRTVILSDNNAPGTSDEEFFRRLSRPILNSRGQVAFRGFLDGPNVISNRNSQVILSEGSGALTLVARQGEQAPGASPGVNFALLNIGMLNSNGQLAIGGAVFGDGSNGVWLAEPDGAISAVALEGDSAFAGSTEVIFARLGSQATLDSNGNVIFYAEIEPVSNGESSNDWSMWSTRAGNPEIIVREGDQAPNTVGGTLLSSLSSRSYSSEGEIAFLSNLSSRTTDKGIFVEKSGLLSLLVRVSDEAPGTSQFATFNDLRAPSVNAAGQAAFWGRVSGRSGSGFGFFLGGIWSGASGELDLVAHRGLPAPGTEEGVEFGSFEISPIINSAGEVAFVADLWGKNVNSSNDKGMWLQSNDDLELIVRSGDHAPGTPDGTSFNTFDDLGMVLNSNGQIAFIAGLAGESVDSSNDVGIWAEDGKGRLQLIAREGNRIEVSPGEFRTISNLRGGFLAESGNDDTRGSGFNDLGQLAFHTYFSDGTEGIFVSNVARIPEPSTCIMLLMSVPVMSQIRRLQ